MAVTELKILYSSDVDSLIADVYWRNFDNYQQMWEKFFCILDYFVHNQEYFKNMSGELSIGVGSNDLSNEQWLYWNTFINNDGIDELKEKYNKHPDKKDLVPSSMAIRLEAAFLIPKEVSTVKYENYDIAIDDFYSNFEFKSEEINDNVANNLKKCWTIVHEDKPEDESILYMEFFFRFSNDTQYMCLSIDSDYDIFRPIQFDGTPNYTHSVLTFKQIMNFLSDLADKTNGTIEVDSSLAEFYP